MILAYKVKPPVTVVLPGILELFLARGFAGSATAFVSGVGGIVDEYNDDVCSWSPYGFDCDFQNMKPLESVMNKSWFTSWIAVPTSERQSVLAPTTGQ